MEAFDLTDYILYAYAIVKFVVATRQVGLQLDDWNKISWAYGLLLASITVIFVRNYSVMHAIDQHKHQMNLTFIQDNSILERIFRFLIVAVVVVTPKNLFPRITDLVSNASSYYVDSIASIFGLSRASDTHNDTAFHDIFYYYGTVIAMLFFLFWIWDVIQAFNIRKEISSNSINCNFDQHNGSANDQKWNDFLSYYNIINGNAKRTSIIVASSSFLYKKILSGGVYWAYFTSFKFIERLLGVCLSASIVLISYNHFESIGATIFTTVFLAAYLSVSWINQGYFWSIFGFFVKWTEYVDNKYINIFVGLALAIFSIKILFGA